MAQAQGVVSNVLVGTGKLYIAPVGEAAPTLGPADTIDWTGGNWVYVGWLDGGVEFGYIPEYNDIKVDEFSAPIQKILNAENMTVKLSLAELFLDNLKEAISASLRTDTAPATMVPGTEELAIGDGTPQIVTLGFEGTPPGVVAADPPGVFRMVIVHRAVAQGEVGQAYTRGEKTMYPVEYGAMADVTQVAGKRLAIITDWEEAALP